MEKVGGFVETGEGRLWRVDGRTGAMEAGVEECMATLGHVHMPTAREERPGWLGGCHRVPGWAGKAECRNWKTEDEAGGACWRPMADYLWSRPKAATTWMARAHRWILEASDGELPHKAGRGRLLPGHLGVSACPQIEARTQALAVLGGGQWMWMKLRGCNVLHRRRRLVARVEGATKNQGQD